jgi:diguanylate cyclase (GGDEF)-like protein
MHFPNISDITTTSIVYTTIDDTLENATKKMYESNHRNIVVVDEKNKNYYILLSHDIVLLKINDDNFKKPLSDFDLTQMPTIHKDKNILESLGFLQSSIEYICVLDKHDNLYGILAFADIIGNIDPTTLMDSYKVGDMIKMSRQVQKSNKEEKTSDALVKMASQKLDSLIIVNCDQPIGIITTKDAIQLLKSESNLTLPVSAYMSSPVDTISEHATIKDALEFLQNHNYRRVVVVDDNGELIGAITQKELISLTYSNWAKLMKDYQKELIEINSILQKRAEDFEEQASHDNLTSLFTRNKFMELFILQYQTMISSKQPLSLLIIDIDDFKHVNDNHGHNSGDRVLKGVAKILYDHTRHIDVLGRWGGDEFILLLPTSDAKTSEMIAQKFHEAIGHYNQELSCSVTLSIGVTQIVAGDTIEKAVERADKAMYQAKESGKNATRVC